MAVFMGIVFGTLLFIGAPIGFTLGITALLCLLRLDNPILLKLIPQRFFAGIETDSCKARLRANTDELIARGGFGSPTIFVGNDMFFGNDRMPLVRAALEATAA